MIRYNVETSNFFDLSENRIIGSKELSVPSEMSRNISKTSDDPSTEKKSWYELCENSESPPKSCPRYLIVRMEEEGKNFNNINPFMICKWISKFSKEIKVKKLRKNGFLFLECPSHMVASNLLNETAFNGIKISVEPHRTLNYSKGVFFCKDIKDLSEIDILEELKSQRVIEIKKIGKDLSNSSLFLVTFDTPDLPKRVFVGYLSVPIRPYIPSPLICFTCGLLGHHRSSCKKEPVCRTCSEAKHEGACNKIKCCLCGENHITSAKTCSIFAEEYEIKKLMVTGKMSYFDAKTLLSKSKQASYASKVTSKIEEPETFSKLVDLIEKMSKRMEIIENILLKQLPQLTGASISPTKNEVAVETVTEVDEHLEEETPAKKNKKKEIAGKKLLKQMKTEISVRCEEETLDTISRQKKSAQDLKASSHRTEESSKGKKCVKPV